MEMQDTNADAAKNDTISSDEARIGVEKSDDEVDIPPDGGYGWVVVACLLSMNSFTWGESLLCVVVRAERRQQHHVRRLRVLLPGKQLLCRRIHLSLCLGWRSVGRCSLPHGSAGQLAGQDIRLQASHAIWYVDLDLIDRANRRHRLCCFGAVYGGHLQVVRDVPRMSGRLVRYRLGHGESTPLNFC